MAYPLGTIAMRFVLLARSARFLAEQPVPELVDVRAGSGAERRLLVCGSGLAVGYGVTSQRQALAGHLANEGALLSGQAVRVSVAVRPRTDLRRMPELLDGVADRSFEGVVWSPSLLEVGRRPSEARARQLDAVLAELERISRGWIVVLGLPGIHGVGGLDSLARAEANRENEFFRGRITNRRRMVFIAPPPVPTVRHNRMFDLHYYRSCADEVSRAAIRGGNVTV